MEFGGIRIAARALNIGKGRISSRLDKIKPLNCKINNINYTMWFKTTKADNNEN